MNKPMYLVAAISLFAACSGPSGPTMEVRAGQVSRAEMESLAELLGHDLYEGRAPGTGEGIWPRSPCRGCSNSWIWNRELPAPISSLL